MKNINVSIETVAFILFSVILFLFYLKYSCLVTPNEYLLGNLKSILYAKTDYFIFLLILPLIFSYVKKEKVRNQIIWVSLILCSSYFALASLALGNFSVFMVLVCFLLLVLAIKYGENFGLLVAIFLPVVGFFFIVLYFTSMLTGSVKYLTVLYFYFIDFIVFAGFILVLATAHEKLFLKYAKYIFLVSLLFSGVMLFLDPFMNLMVQMNNNANHLVFYMKNARSVKQVFTNDYLIKFYSKIYGITTEKPHKHMIPFTVCINNNVFNNTPECTKNSKKLITQKFYDIYVITYTNKSFCQLS